MDMNRSMLLDFEEILNLPEFQNHFNYLELQLSAFLRWIYTSENEVATRIVARMAQKKASRKGKKFTSLFDPTENQVLRELGTEQMRQLNRAALSVRTLSDGSQSIRQMFRNTFQTLRIPVALLNGCSFLQTVLGGKGSGRYNFTAPTRLEAVMYFHTICLLWNAIKSKRVSIRVTYRVGNAIGLVVQLICKAWIAFVKEAKLNTLTDFIRPYAWYDESVGYFVVLSKREDGFVSRSQTTSMANQNGQ